MRRFYHPTDIILGGSIDLSEDESRHLRDVLRLSVGDLVSIFDGRGSEYSCKIITIGKRRSTLDIIEQIDPAAPESPFSLTIAAAITQNDKFDLVIQKSVELGVIRLRPLKTARSEVSLKDAARRLDRWRRIAMEATKQCGRARIMEIAEPTSIETLFADHDGNVLMFSERDGEKLTPTVNDSATAVFGPKGGWADEELESARQSGWNIVTFGGRIMRAETAAIGITAILQNKFGDLN